MEFKVTYEGVFLHQVKYTQDILKRFKMNNCNTIVTPLETEAKLRKDIEKSLDPLGIYATLGQIFIKVSDC